MCLYLSLNERAVASGGVVPDKQSVHIFCISKKVVGDVCGWIIECDESE